VLDESFAESFVNCSHRVLGLKLLPFSLWGRFQLELISSPFLEGGNILPTDLENACRACRLVYPRTISPKIKWWSFRWRLAGRNFQDECTKFSSYLEDYFAPPRFLPVLRKKFGHQEAPQTHPPPEAMQIFSAVVTMTGWPEEKIWMLPVGKAYWYAAGHWYQAGIELDFLTPEHLILKKRIDAIRAQKQKEKVKQNG
jgi:hypothetical protein